MGCIMVFCETRSGHLLMTHLYSNKKKNKTISSGVWMLYLHKNILCHIQYHKYQISQIAFIQDGEINTLIKESKVAVRSSLDISHTFNHCT